MRTLSFLMFALLSVLIHERAEAVLVSHWALDDGSPSQIATDTPGTNDATLGTTAGVDAADPTWTTSSKLGTHAFDLDGGDFASAPDSASLDGMSGLTLSAWINRDLTLTREIFVGKGDAATDPTTSYWLEITAGDEVNFYLSNGGGSNLTAGSLSDTTDWHHIVGTYDGINKRLYLDGVQIGSPQAFSGTVNNTPTSFSIGKVGTFGALELDGMIDDVGLWNDGLTSPEVLALFNLAENLTLQYDLGEADQLFELHNAGSGYVVVDGTVWIYATGLTGGPGVVQQVGDEFFLQLDASGTGVQTQPLVVPEPSTVMLLSLGGLGLVWHVRRRRRG